VPVCLTPTDRVARSPVFSRDGTRLAYLGNQKGFDVSPILFSHIYIYIGIDIDI
jgi:hypothetical protein